MKHLLIVIVGLLLLGCNGQDDIAEIHLPVCASDRPSIAPIWKLTKLTVNDTVAVATLVCSNGKIERD